jgi:ABC-type iron transport system FetAB ATPase subunit
MAHFLTAGPFSARNGEGRELYRDVSVELDESELVVLDGPSGSGKSTLLRQVAALDPVDDIVWSLGGETFQPASFPRWRSRATLVAQDAPMLMATVGENVRFPFAQKSAESRLDEDRMSALMARVGLDAILLDRDVGTLSGGERHRLALVRGLLWDPPVLLADEPLSGLDEELARVCFELLRGFAHRPGHAALCVLHERMFADAADRHIALVSSTGERAR